MFIVDNKGECSQRHLEESRTGRKISRWDMASRLDLSMRGAREEEEMIKRQGPKRVRPKMIKCTNTQSDRFIRE